jgi:hypothetical protein
MANVQVIAICSTECNQIQYLLEHTEYFFLLLQNFEKLIYTRLHTHLVDNNILTPQQFAFRAVCSTDQATFSLVNSILEAMNQNLMIGGNFCDLHKAFDSVNHEIIFEKVKFCGI